MSLIQVIFKDVLNLFVTFNLDNIVIGARWIQNWCNYLNGAIVAGCSFRETSAFNKMRKERLGNISAAV